MEIDIYNFLGIKKPERVIPQIDDLIMLVGVVDNIITKNGVGSQIFRNFDEAKKVFPELNAENWSDNFTWSQGYQKLRYYQYSPFGFEKTEAVRFETRIAYERLSS